MGTISHKRLLKSESFLSESPRVTVEVFTSKMLPLYGVSQCVPQRDRGMIQSIEACSPDQALNHVLSQHIFSNDYPGPFFSSEIMVKTIAKLDFSLESVSSSWLLC